MVKNIAVIRGDGIGPEIVGEAIKVLDLPVDSWADWKQSVYSDCINPYLGSDDWTVDPRWLQQAMSKKNNALALK